MNLTMSAFLSCMGPGTILNEKLNIMEIKLKRFSSEEVGGWGMGQRKIRIFRMRYAQGGSFFKGLCMYNIISLFPTFLVKGQCSLVKWLL